MKHRAANLNISSPYPPPQQLVQYTQTHDSLEPPEFVMQMFHASVMIRTPATFQE